MFSAFNTMDMIILIILLYLTIGFVIGAYLSIQKYGWKKILCGRDIIKDFTLKGILIAYFGIKIYFEERAKKQASADSSQESKTIIILCK